MKAAHVALMKATGSLHIMTEDRRELIVDVIKFAYQRRLVFSPGNFLLPFSFLFDFL